MRDIWYQPRVTPCPGSDLAPGGGMVQDHGLADTPEGEAVSSLGAPAGSIVRRHATAVCPGCGQVRTLKRNGRMRAHALTRAQARKLGLTQ